MSRKELPFVLADGVASLDFSASEAPQRHHDRLLATCARAFSAGAHRIEVTIAASDEVRRRSLHRAGFRLEGTLRGRLLTESGPADALVYARLSQDVHDGAHGFTAVMNSVTARKRVISHLLLTDGADRVCILQTSFKPDFELPGGIIEVGESPREGVVREVREELSHQVEVGRLLVVDWLAPYLGWEDAVELIFDGGELDEAARPLLRPDLREIRAVHWLAPDAAAERMAAFARGRLLAALAARAEGRTWYLEAGRRIS